MYYIKDNNRRLEINAENVFTTCPKCGREFSVNLEEHLAGGEHDLSGTQTLCAECSAKQAESAPSNYANTLQRTSPKAITDDICEEAAIDQLDWRYTIVILDNGGYVGGLARFKHADLAESFRTFIEKQYQSAFPDISFVLDDNNPPFSFSTSLRSSLE